MSAYLPVALRQQLLEADDHRCVYCQTTEFNSGYPMVVDHIVPRSKGGSTSFENLCFAGHRCNEFKGAATEMEELLTGEITPLFLLASRPGIPISPGTRLVFAFWG